MPRRPRVVLPHIPLHLIQRGNNRQVCFVAHQNNRGQTTVSHFKRTLSFSRGAGFFP